MEAIVDGKADAWRRRIDDQRASAIWNFCAIWESNPDGTSPKCN
jgi:hypothetical protein